MKSKIPLIALFITFSILTNAQQYSQYFDGADTIIYER